MKLELVSLLLWLCYFVYVALVGASSVLTSYSHSLVTVTARISYINSKTPPAYEPPPSKLKMY